MTAAFRYETGGDWTSYTEIFNAIEPIDDVLSGKNVMYSSMPIEPAYKLLNSLVRTICNNVQAVFFCVALLISTLLFISFPRYSPKPIISVLVYFGILFFALDMIVIRQGIAVAMVFYAYKYIEARDWKHFLVYILAASTFHTSALVIFPVYYLAHKRFKTSVILYVVGIFILIFLLNIHWMRGIITVVVNFAVSSNLLGKYAEYLIQETFAVPRSVNLGTIINVVIFIMLIVSRRDLERYKYFNLFLNLFICYLFSYFAMYELAEISNRMKYYFMISLTILLPIWIDAYKSNANKILSYACVCLFAFMYCRAQLLEAPIASAFNPYQNYIIHTITGKKSTGYERLMKSDREFNKERSS